MKIVKIVLVCMVAWYGNVSAMLHGVLPEIRWSIAEHPKPEQLGDEDASPVMQERLKDVVTEYHKKGWNLPANIMLKQMNDSAIEDLKKIGSTTPNVVNNGVDTLHITCNHEQLTENESKQLLAHELAHITLGKYTLLNPHWYMSKYIAHPLMNTLAVNSAVGLAVKKGRNPLLLLGTVLISWAYGIQVINIKYGVGERTKTLRPLPGDSLGKMGTYYNRLSKLEEIECDLIAAFVMPEGGKHGAALWQRKLAMYGDRNGTKGSHPYYSTRIKYHKAVQWIQEKCA